MVPEVLDRPSLERLGRRLHEKESLALLPIDLVALEAIETEHGCNAYQSLVRAAFKAIAGTRRGLGEPAALTPMGIKILHGQHRPSLVRAGRDLGATF